MEDCLPLKEYKREQENLSQNNVDINIFRTYLSKNKEYKYITIF